MCAPSTFDTKCKRLPDVAKAAKACVTICGPMLEPPMPMLTMSVICASARICSANANMDDSDVAVKTLLGLRHSAALNASAGGGSGGGGGGGGEGGGGGNGGGDARAQRSKV